jgi:hypothetical protein
MQLPAAPTVSQEVKIVKQIRTPDRPLKRRIVYLEDDDEEEDLGVCIPKRSRGHSSPSYSLAEVCVQP